MLGQTKDVEEKEQCERMHELIKQYKLEGQLRWLVAQKDRVANGELYRYIAGAALLRCDNYEWTPALRTYIIPCRAGLIKLQGLLQSWCAASLL